MKKSLLLIFALFAGSSAIAQQQQDYLDTIANKACECIETKNLIETYKGEELTMQLGICLMLSAKDHREQLLSDHGLDLDKLDVEGEQLGILIGSRMAFVCPDLLMAAAGEAPEELSYLTETGTITAISEAPFVVFTIKTPEGRSKDFYWLAFISSQFDLQNDFRNLKGKQVSVEYLEEELFDPRINDYRYFNHLSGIQVIE